MAGPAGHGPGAGGGGRGPDRDDPEVREGERGEGRAAIARAGTDGVEGPEPAGGVEDAVERDLREGLGRLARIQKTNLGIALVLAGASAAWGGIRTVSGPDAVGPLGSLLPGPGGRALFAALSLLAGTGLVAAGLRMWRWILLEAFREPGRTVRGVGWKAALKISLLIPAVWVLVVKVGVSIGPFAVGVGTLPLALVVEALRGGTVPAAPRTDLSGSGRR